MQAILIHSVYRYNETIQKRIGSNTKPEPWLHVAICNRIMKNDGKLFLFYAIYVWDTRQVIETGKADGNITGVHRGFVRASDNHKPLSDKGFTFDKDSVNKPVATTNKPTASKVSKKPVISTWHITYQYKSGDEYDIATVWVKASSKSEAISKFRDEYGGKDILQVIQK